MGYNSAYIRDISQMFAFNREFGGQAIQCRQNMKPIRNGS